MVLAGIKVVDTPLVHDAIELVRSSSEPYLFNHAMRSWLFGVLLAEHAEPAPDPELLAVSAVLHDLGLTERYSAQERFEVDGANAGALLSEGTGHSGTSDPIGVGRYRASYDSFHCSSQRARGCDDAFRNRCGRDWSRYRSNSSSETSRNSCSVSSLVDEEAVPGLSLQSSAPEADYQLRQLPAGYWYAVCGGLHSADLHRSLRKRTFCRVVSLVGDRELKSNDQKKRFSRRARRCPGT